MKKLAITDLNEFAHLIRSTAATSLAEEYVGESKQYTDEDLESIITLKQVLSIIDENAIGIDERSRYIISDIIFEDMFDEIRNQIYQSTMAQLAAKGYVECAWDDEQDKMIFWVAEKKS